MKKWVLRVFLALAGAYLLAVLLARFVPLQGVRKNLERTLTPSEGWYAEIGDVHLSLWKGLAIEVSGLSLYRDRPGTRLEVFHTDTMRAEIVLGSLFKKEKHLRLRIIRPRLLVAYGFGLSAENGAAEQDRPASPGALVHDILDSPSGQTLIATIGALVRMNRGLKGLLGKEAGDYRIDQAEIRGVDIRVVVPTYDGTGAVPVALEDLNLGAVFPQEKEPGVFWAQGNLQVASERRDVQLQGIIEETHEAGGTPNLFGATFDLYVGNVQIGTTARASGAHMIHDLRSRLYASVGVPLDESLPADSSTEAIHEAGAEQEKQTPDRAELRLRIPGGLEALDPLWGPIIGQKFRWKFHGGADFAFVREEQAGKVTQVLHVDLSNAGILRGGLIHKTPGVPAQLALTFESGESGPGMPAGAVEIGPLKVNFRSLPLAAGSPESQFEFNGQTSDLAQVASFFPGEVFTPATSAGLVMQGTLRMDRRALQVTQINMRELSLYSGQSDLHLSGKAKFTGQAAAEFMVASDRLIASDWLSKPLRESLGPVGSMLNVPLDAMNGRIGFQNRQFYVSDLKAGWAQGILAATGYYAVDHCRGEGYLSISRVPLIPLAKALRVEGLMPGLRGGAVAIEGEIGRDLPCSAVGPAALDAWGANLDVVVDHLNLPILTDSTGDDLALLEKMSGALLRPLPKVRGGVGTLRWQGKQARLEDFELDAAPLFVRIEGDLGAATEALALKGELVAPRVAAPEAPLMEAVQIEKDYVHFPLEITGSWSKPKIDLSYEGANLRDALLHYSEELQIQQGPEQQPREEQTP